jgi:hypothetical protein
MFEKDDICISSFESRSNKKGITKRYCKVRIISVFDYNTHNEPIYNVYNIDLEKYEKIGSFYLKLDLTTMRDKKIDELLNKKNERYSNT